MKIQKVFDPILQKPMQKSSENNRTQTVLFLVFTILIVVGIIYFVPRNLTQIEAYIATNGLWGMLVAVLLYGLLGLTLIPSLFGPWTATLSAGVGNTLAAVVEYHLGSRLNKMTHFVEKKEKLPLGLGKLPVTAPSFLIFARMIPGYGPKAVSVLAGVYRVPMFLYVWTSVIPTFAGAAIFAFGGSGLVGLFHQ
jgi:uncharacterized membrane protein YdjX (TVP38/TMEM64 family)